MEKFLKVCWEKDKLSGESNFVLYNDYEPGTLFYTETDTVRINEYKEQLLKAILTKEINNNIEGMKHALFHGVPTRAYVEVIEDIKDKIEIIGKFNKKITNIHRLKGNDVYQIKVK
jgi:hypothetical protein